MHEITQAAGLAAYIDPTEVNAGADRIGASAVRLLSAGAEQ